VSSRFDITLDGNKFKVVRGVEGQTGYKRGFQRRETQDPNIRPSTRIALSSRDDRPTFYQTSWSGGSTWWNPLYGPDNINTYSDATNFDAFTKPGTLIPRSKSTAVSTAMGLNTPLFGVGGALYTIGTTLTTYYDVWKWTPGSNDWVKETGYTSGVLDADGILWGGVYQASEGYAYMMSKTKVGRFDLGSNTDAQILTVDATYGDNIMQTADGKIWVYDDGLLKEVTDPGGSPSFTTRSNDGFGPDIINSMATPGTQLVFENQLKLAVAGAGGAFVVKNSWLNGQPQAVLSRIDRDQSGSYIRYPQTELPPGVLALNITMHLGSVIIAATQDWSLAMANDATKSEVPRVDFYSWKAEGGLGVIGSPDRENPSEYVVSFLGALGHHLLIGSQSRVWVYDAQNGGIHPYMDLTDASEGVFVGASLVVDSDGNSRLLVKEDAGSSVMKLIQDDPTTSATLGGDLTTYVFTSNYFDYNRPFEDKTLTEINVQSELLGGTAAVPTQRYTIQIEVDGGTWTTRATHEGPVTFSSTDVALLELTGKRFRYRVIYESTDATIQGLQGVEIRCSAGEMVPFLELMLDGTQTVNVENQVVDPEDVYDWLETSAQKETPIVVVDAFRSEREDDTATSTMKFSEMTIIKDEPGEAKIACRLVGL